MPTAPAATVLRVLHAHPLWPLKHPWKVNWLCRWENWGGGSTRDLAKATHLLSCKTGLQPKLWPQGLCSESPLHSSLHTKVYAGCGGEDARCHWHSSAPNPQKRHEGASLFCWIQSIPSNRIFFHFLFKRKRKSHLDGIFPSVRSGKEKRKHPLASYLLSGSRNTLIFEV